MRMTRSDPMAAATPMVVPLLELCWLGGVGIPALNIKTRKTIIDRLVRVWSKMSHFTHLYLSPSLTISLSLSLSLSLSITRTEHNSNKIMKLICLPFTTYFLGWSDNVSHLANQFNAGWTRLNNLEKCLVQVQHLTNYSFVPSEFSLPYLGYFKFFFSCVSSSYWTRGESFWRNFQNWLFFLLLLYFLMSGWTIPEPFVAVDIWQLAPSHPDEQ